jgi:hypothetical protein
MSKWLTKDFLALKKAWYQKLTNEGFQDHEETIGGQEYLRSYSSGVFNRSKKLAVDEKVDYYDLILAAFWASEFDDEVDKFVMRRHSEGAIIKEISTELKILLLNKELTRRRCKGHRQTTRLIIRKYENRWGIRRWSPDQLKRKTWVKKKTPTP